MRPPRWPFHGAIPLVVLSALAAGAAAAERPPDSAAISPPRCSVEPATIDPQATLGGWWRLDPVLDEAGGLVGQNLHAGDPDGRRYRVGLPAESFASGPVGGRVLVGADDGSTSELSLLDLEAGCLDPVATERAVVRRAIIDPTGSSIFEFRVDRRSRADLGVWRRDLATDRRPVRVLRALPADERFGITWTTELGWGDDGRLVVGSCGAVACRTRILDTSDGTLTMVAEADLGEPVGVADGRLVSYLACRGLPCPIVAIDLADGERRSLAFAAGLATIAEVDGESMLVHESVDSAGALEIVALTGGPPRRIDIGASHRLVVPGSRTGSAIDLPPGWVATGTGGRIDGLGPADGVRVRDGHITPAAEVTP